MPVIGPRMCEISKRVSLLSIPLSISLVTIISIMPMETIPVSWADSPRHPTPHFSVQTVPSTHSTPQVLRLVNWDNGTLIFKACIRHSENICKVPSIVSIASNSITIIMMIRAVVAESSGTSEIDLTVNCEFKRIHVPEPWRFFNQNPILMGKKTISKIYIIKPFVCVSLKNVCTRFSPKILINTNFWWFQ